MQTRHDERHRLIADLIDDIDIAMLTTVRPDGRLVSRPLRTQNVEFDGDLWFFTGLDSHKVAEIARDAHVNVAYASPSKNSYVSASGVASLVRDPRKIDELWKDAYKAFFPEGKDDPNLALLKVAVESVEYWDGPSNGVAKAVQFAAARITKDPSKLGENDTIELSPQTTS